MNCRILHYILFGVICLISISCREDYEVNRPSQNLVFSADEIFLNTVFTDMESSTYTLTVKNEEDHDIVIPSIFLNKGGNSFYILEVDGIQNETGQFEDVLIRKNDFITLYISILAKESNNALYEDVIVFNLGNSIQEVQLSSVVEDVDLFKSSNENSYYEIATDTVWDNTKSKIIYDELRVKSGATLTIEKGTNIYFYTNSGLIVESGAELVINGTKEELVSFKGYRTEPEYDTIIGTWDKIVFNNDAKGKIDYAYIKGATTAIEIIKANVELTNTQIYNSEQFGLYAENATINASNLVVNHAARYSVFLNEGGNYDFKQCTIANYWPYTSNEEVALYVSNAKSDNGQLTYGQLNASFANSILYSQESDGLKMFIDQENATAILNFESNLINEKSGDVDFSSAIFSNILLNQDPLLKDATLFSSNNLNLIANSPAINQGDVTTANSVPEDIEGVNRTSLPDLGAYERN